MILSLQKLFLIKYVYGFKSNYPDLQFNCKDFRDYYGNGSFIFDSGTIEEGLINLMIK